MLLQRLFHCHQLCHLGLGLKLFKKYDKLVHLCHLNIISLWKSIQVGSRMYFLQVCHCSSSRVCEKWTNMHQKTRRRCSKCQSVRWSIQKDTKEFGGEIHMPNFKALYCLVLQIGPRYCFRDGRTDDFVTDGQIWDAHPCFNMIFFWRRSIIIILQVTSLYICPYISDALI